MGGVYRADDLKLGQTVALKFLPLSLSGNEDALKRFHSEVRLARQISHPNVCRSSMWATPTVAARCASPISASRLSPKLKPRPAIPASQNV